MKKIFNILLTLCIILCVVFILTGCGTKNEEVKVDYTKLSDTEFLTTINSWEQEGAPGVIMNFEADGKGKNTTTMGNEWFNMSWILDENILITTTEWITGDLVDDWFVEFDKENVAMEITNVDTGKKVKYLKAGTQKIDIDESNKDEKLIGVWYSSGIFPEALSLQVDEKLSGKGFYNTETNEALLDTVYIKWSADGKTLKTLLPTGKVSEYSYEFESEQIKIYKNGELIDTYTKAADAKIEKIY